MQIIASDIYSPERIDPLDPALKKRYFQRGTGSNAGLVRVVRMLRPDGLFFADHSESFVQANHVVKLVCRTVYQPVPGGPT